MLNHRRGKVLRVLYGVEVFGKMDIPFFSKLPVYG